MSVKSFIFDALIIITAGLISIILGILRQAIQTISIGTKEVISCWESNTLNSFFLIDI